MVENIYTMSAAEYITKSNERKDYLNSARESIVAKIKTKCRSDVINEIDKRIHIIAAGILIKEKFTNEEPMVTPETKKRVRIKDGDEIRYINWRCKNPTQINFISSERHYHLNEANEILHFISPKLKKLVDEIRNLASTEVWQGTLEVETEYEKTISAPISRYGDHIIKTVTLKHLKTNLREDDYRSEFKIRAETLDEKGDIDYSEYIITQLLFDDDIFNEIKKIMELSNQKLDDMQKQHSNILIAALELIKKYDFYDYLVAHELCKDTKS